MLLEGRRCIDEFSQVELITDLATFSAALETTDEAKAKWEEITAYLADLEAKIGDGTIKVTNKQNGDSFDEASCPNINFK